MIRAGIYVRISDDPDDLQEGVTRQTEDCVERAEELGWEITETYRENNVSAWNARKLRPEYQRMTDDLLAGNIDAIVVWDIDRLLRRPIELERLIEAVEKKGGNRVADASGEYQLSNGDHQDILRHKAIAANKESRDKSRRVKRKALQRAKQGLPVHANASKRRPFGYDFDFKTIRPDEAKLLRSAAKAIVEGSDSVSGICRKWEQQGVKTSRGGERWSYQALKSILIAPRIAGLMEHQGEVLLEKNGDPVRAQWDPILDPDMWRQVREELTDPSRRTNFVQGTGRRYLLTGGLGVCGACGDRLTSRPRERTGGDNRAYGCRRKSGCGLRQAAPELEDFVKDAVILALTRGALGKVLRRKSGEESKEQKLLGELERINRTLRQLDNDHYDGLIPRDRWLQQKTRQEELRQDISHKLQQNSSTKVLAGLAGASEDDLRSAWEERGLKWQHAVVSSVVEQVTVKPDKRRGKNRFDPSRVEIIWKA
jgi:DNA invertase Pin-like site-specific DNA recombinase